MPPSRGACKSGRPPTTTGFCAPSPPAPPPADYYMRESFSVTAVFLTPMVMLECGRAFNGAAKIATGRYVARVARATMPTHFVAMFRWKEFRAFALKESLSYVT